IQVEGVVKLRQAGTENSGLATGAIEVVVTDVTVINTSKTTPFVIGDKTDASEDIRLKYRYLDLRRPVMYNTLQLRSKVTNVVRNFLDQEGFLDVETPMLTKSTPEGARDYLVPSRVHPGMFYALPQSPQIFKQLLMVSGLERYYQIARCFRDEDLRADRQPEFTQIDMEMSFMSQDEIMGLAERMIAAVMKETKGMDVILPLPRMKFDDAMERFGSDKPDTRFGLEIQNIGEVVKDSGFKVFGNAVRGGGVVKALCVKGAAANYSRKDIDALTDFVAVYGAKGLAWLKVEADGIKGPIAKFFSPEESASMLVALGAEEGDLLLFVADSNDVACAALGALRQKLGKDLDLIDESVFNFLWITDWPLLEYDRDAGRYFAAHHPFTSPVREDIPLLNDKPENARAQAYDLVLNGYELGGGSVRIYERELQEKMFEVLGFSKEEAEEQFGFLLEAFGYGTPPHGGIALGLDRFVMLLAGRTNLRDTIAFPKTANAGCLLTEAPAYVAADQLAELQLVSVAKRPVKED
ncbi:MAG: aspartate--tRNA ligase, partial [Bacilli bacterium]